MSASIVSTTRGSAAREDAIDALRGFALLGIAVVNLGAMSSAFFGSGWADPAFTRPVDLMVQWLVRCLFEAKFYLLFSALFGYSLALQQSSAERSGATFAPRWWRRSLGLAALGLAHGILFFPGDILLPYALLGLLLWALSTLQRPQLPYWAAGLLLSSALAWLLLAWLTPAHSPDDAASAWAHAQHAQQALRGPVSQVWAHNLQQLVDVVWPLIAWVQAPSALAMMLLGYHLAATDTLRHGQQPSWHCKPWLWAVLALWGLGGALGYATLGQPPTTVRGTLLAMSVGVLSAPALALLYAALLWQALHGVRAQRWRAWLAPAGRMALSLYLMQTLTGALLFTGWGVALVGRLSPALVLLLALALYASQLVLARGWMARHRYGPVEWWLRAWTYGYWPTKATPPPETSPCPPERNSTP